MAFRILVCDDEKLIRWSLSEHLKEEGYEVATVEDGAQALASIESKPPDALLLDIKMPKIDGMSLLRRLCDDGNAFPVIVITAHGCLDAGIEATKLGAAAYLSKPFDLREVSLQLGKVLEKSRLETEMRSLRDRATQQR